MSRPVHQTASGTICLGIGEHERGAEKTKHVHLEGLVSIKSILVDNWAIRPRRATIGSEVGGSYQASEAVLWGRRSPRNGSEREEGARRREPSAMQMGMLVAAGADAGRLLRPHPPSGAHSEPRGLALAILPPQLLLERPHPPLQAASGLVPPPRPVLAMGWPGLGGGAPSPWTPDS